MSYAQQHQYAILTSDLDFGERLRVSGDSHPSVIQLRSELLAPENLGEMVLHALERLAHEIESGYLITLDGKKMRARTLPFPGR